MDTHRLALIKRKILGCTQEDITYHALMDCGLRTLEIEDREETIAQLEQILQALTE